MLDKENKMEERWEWVVGFKGLYQVSTTGKFKSFKSKKFREMDGYILKLTLRGGRKNKNKYLSADFYKDGVRKTKFPAQEVLKSFVGPRPPGKETYHIDSNNLNNNLDNLLWKTPKENTAESIRIGTHYFNYNLRNKYQEI